jgi:hypothetical protein
MGQSNKRVGKHGKVTWTAVYEDVRGVRRSAGTFDTLPKANKAWQNAEAKASEGRLTPVRRGARRFGPFVAEWFPRHPLEDRSRENYTLYLESLIVPYFTESRMIDIMSNHIRDFVADMVAEGVPTSSIEYCLVILGAIFTAALKEGIVLMHPCRGVSAPPRAKKVRQIITPEEWWRGGVAEEGRMNERTRRAALYAIGIIAVLASADALAHSYTGLYSWALHHRLDGWQAMSWPAEIDVFLVLGELALYIAYLDSWSARDRVWPWISAVVGLAVSVAGNVGHIQPMPGAPVTVDDQLTAAASPLAAFAGLMIGFLVLKMTRRGEFPADAHSAAMITVLSALQSGPPDASSVEDKIVPRDVVPTASASSLDKRLLADAIRIVRDAAANGQPISQRALAV